MLIHCTKRACERLKITPPVAEKEFNPLYSWRLNIIEEGRQRLVVFMNDASRYCVALENIKARDLAKLTKIFTERLREVLLAEQINPDVIDRYLAELGEAEYFKNADKNMTARLNKACETAKLGYHYENGYVNISRYVNRMLVGTKGSKDYFEPCETFHAMLAEYGLPLKQCHAFEFDVELDTKSGSVLRTIVVPADINFEQFATVIRKAFGWWNHKNRFMFMLCGSGGHGKLFLSQKRDEPSTITIPPTLVMKDVKLSDLVLNSHRIFEFLYDYAAQWKLCISLKADYLKYTGEIPCLKSGSGNAPPEDVGGEDGFAEFLYVLENGKSKERREKTQWGKHCGYEIFDEDFEKIKREVELSLRW